MIIGFTDPQYKNRRSKNMTRLQLELARKAAQLGCTTKYPDTVVCEFWMDGTMLSVLFPENMYCPVLDGSESKRKCKAESKLANVKIALRG